MRGLSGQGGARLPYGQVCLLAPQSVSDELYQCPFSPTAVKFPVKDLLPRAKVELPLRDGNNNLATHDCA